MFFFVLCAGQLSGALAESAQVAGVNTVQQQQPAPKDDWSWLKNGLKWFCGLDGSQKSSASTQSYVTRLRDLTSLRQSSRERTILYTALTFLFILDVFLYVFFSTGSDLGLLHKAVNSSNSVGFDNTTAYVRPVSYFTSASSR
jgi:hypothetical protein